MGFIRSAMKGLKDVGRKLITPRLGSPTYGERRRGPSRSTRTMSVKKREKRRFRRDKGYKW